MDLQDLLLLLHQYLLEDPEILSDQLLQYYQSHQWLLVDLKDHHIQADL